MEFYYNIITTIELGEAKLVSDERLKPVYVKSENKEVWTEWLTADEVRKHFPELAKNLTTNTPQS